MVFNVIQCFFFAFNSNSSNSKFRHFEHRDVDINLFEQFWRPLKNIEFNSMLVNGSKNQFFQHYFVPGIEITYFLTKSALLKNIDPEY